MHPLDIKRPKECEADDKAASGNHACLDVVRESATPSHEYCPCTATSTPQCHRTVCLLYENADTFPYGLLNTAVDSKASLCRTFFCFLRHEVHHHASARVLMI